MLLRRMKPRKIDSGEFDRLYKNTPSEVVEKLTIELTKEYEFLLKQDGIRAKDIKPLKGKRKEYSEWINRYKSLKNVIRDFSCEGICGGLIGRVYPTMFEPFWDIKIE